MKNARIVPVVALLALTACVGPGHFNGLLGFGWHLGLVGTLVLIADLWACFHIWGAPRSLLARVLWTLLVWSFPVGGVIFFAIFGDRRGVTG
jgi:hypothetical protein